MPCRLLAGTRIRLGSCVKQGRKLERKWGLGRVRKIREYFLPYICPFRSVPYATHRTFYYPCATLRSLSYKIKDYRQARLVSSILATTKDQPNKQKPSRFCSGFFRGSKIEKGYFVKREKCLFCFQHRYPELMSENSCRSRNIIRVCMGNLAIVL